MFYERDLGFQNSLDRSRVGRCRLRDSETRQRHRWDRLPARGRRCRCDGRRRRHWRHLAAVIGLPPNPDKKSNQANAQQGIEQGCEGSKGRVPFGFSRLGSCPQIHARRIILKWSESKGGKPGLWMAKRSTHLTMRTPVTLVEPGLIQKASATLVCAGQLVKVIHPRNRPLPE